MQILTIASKYIYLNIYTLVTLHLCNGNQLFSSQRWLKSDWKCGIVCVWRGAKLCAHIWKSVLLCLLTLLWFSLKNLWLRLMTGSQSRSDISTLLACSVFFLLWKGERNSSSQLSHTNHFAVNKPHVTATAATVGERGNVHIRAGVERWRAKSWAISEGCSVPHWCGHESLSLSLVSLYLEWE